MHVAAGATKLTQSKSEAFSKLDKTYNWGDLLIIIGVFGLYRQFLSLYELGIRHWRYILPKQPQQGKLSKK